jgi:O-succinylbenzoic acid--CoA ligase
MHDWLKDTARGQSDKLALITPEQTLTFPQLDRMVDQAAAWLIKQAGYKHHDKLCFVPSNLFVSTVLIYAALRVYLVVVPFNARLTQEERARQLESIGESSSALLETESLDPTVWDEVAPLDLEDRPLFPRHKVAAILFTSGTSGTPKAAQLTYGNFASNAYASSRRIPVQPTDRWLLCLPLYHIGGLSILMRAAMYGTSVVIPPDTRIESIMRALHENQITHVSLVPTQLYRMIEAGFSPPPSLRLVLLGGAAASPELLARSASLNIPIATTYGLTEATSQVATMPPEYVRRKPGSVGKPLDGVTVRVVDEAGGEQPPNTFGEIIVSGLTVMKGYVGQPWTGFDFATGDIGYFDDDGDLWIVQRRTDLIVSGGENVYPVEVENALRQHPAVDDAAVVGVAHPEWGQQVAAAVVLRRDMSLSADELGAFVRGKLAGYKVPRRVVFVEQLPQTTSGKIQRTAIKDLFSDTAT